MSDRSIEMLTAIADGQVDDSVIVEAFRAGRNFKMTRAQLQTLASSGGGGNVITRRTAVSGAAPIHVSLDPAAAITYYGITSGGTAGPEVIIIDYPAFSPSAEPQYGQRIVIELVHQANGSDIPLVCLSNGSGGVTIAALDDAGNELAEFTNTTGHGPAPAAVPIDYETATFTAIWTGEEMRWSDSDFNNDAHVIPTNTYLPINSPPGISKNLGWDAVNHAPTWRGNPLDSHTWNPVTGGDPGAGGTVLDMNFFASTVTTRGLGADAVQLNIVSDEPIGISTYTRSQNGLAFHLIKFNVATVGGDTVEIKAPGGGPLLTVHNGGNCSATLNVPGDWILFALVNEQNYVVVAAANGVLDKRVFMPGGWGSQHFKTDGIGIQDNSPGFDLGNGRNGADFCSEGGAGLNQVKLPDAFEGLECGYYDGAGAPGFAQFLAKGTDIIEVGTSQSSAGGTITSSGKGGYVRLRCFNDGVWTCTQFVGTWVLA